MKRKTIFFIDPMSYNNLELYDTFLLMGQNNSMDIFFFSNTNMLTKEINGVCIKKIFNYSNKFFLLKPLYYILSLIKLFVYFLKIKPSVAHIQWFKIPVVDLLYYKIIKHLFKVKILHTVHNVVPHDGKRKDIKRYSQLYELSDSLILHTENSLNEIKKIIPNEKLSKFNIIPHGVLKYPFKDSTIEQSILKIKKEKIFDNKFIFAFLGSQGKYKGIDILIDVWINTPELSENNNILLLIAGKGYIPNKDELVKLSNVFIDNNFIDDLSFVSYMKMSDVILLPYIKISQSGVLLTAINFNKPILASKIGGLVDPFKLGKIGWLIKPNNKDDLKEKMLYIINHTSEVDLISKDNDVWNKLNDYYDWKAIQNKTFLLYEKLS